MGRPQPALLSGIARIAAIAAIACAVFACGRSGFDPGLTDDDGGTPTSTATPSPSGTPVLTTPVPSLLVISEVFLRDQGSADSDANLGAGTSGGANEDDKFVEIVNTRADAILDLTDVTIHVGSYGQAPVEWHRFPAGFLLPPLEAAVVFNARGADLSALAAAVGSGAHFTLASASPTVGWLDLAEARTLVELRNAAGGLLHAFAADRNSGGIMQVAWAIDPTNPASDVIEIESDTCNVFGFNCGGVYSVALEVPFPWSQGIPYVDHRRTIEGCTPATDPSFPCCAMSPGRFVASDGAEKVCRRFGLR